MIKTTQSTINLFSNEVSPYCIYLFLSLYSSWVIWFSPTTPFALIGRTQFQYGGRGIEKLNRLLVMFSVPIRLIVGLVVLVFTPEYGENGGRILVEGLLEGGVWEKPLGSPAQADRPPCCWTPLHPLRRLPAQLRPCHCASPAAGEWCSSRPMLAVGLETGFSVLYGVGHWLKHTMKV